MAVSGDSAEVTGGILGPTRLVAVHLVSIVRGSNSICTANDLDLKISDDHGFTQPLIAKSITKLTPEQVAAIPKKYRPN